MTDVIALRRARTTTQAYGMTIFTPMVARVRYVEPAVGATKAVDEVVTERVLVGLSAG